MVSIRDPSPRDRAGGNTKFTLGQHKHIVPETRLVPALQFREVEVGAGAALQQSGGIMEQIESGIDQTAGERIPPSSTRCFSGKCQPRGRIISTAVRSARA